MSKLERFFIVGLGVLVALAGLSLLWPGWLLWLVLVFLFRGVLVNLMDNAIKFSGERRSIRIETGRENGRVFLAITDQGVGIPESQQGKIFEKFYRIGSTLVHETKGSGLGLAIVKHIMDDHGGEVRVGSKPGEGSTFTLVFPIATEDLTNGPDSRR